MTKLFERREAGRAAEVRWARSKRSWTADEDEKLRKLVIKNGAFRWSLISQSMENRSGKQCRERWFNQINPRIKNKVWTREEDWLLFLYQRLLGNRWAEIERKFEGRTDNSVKNHWNSTMRKSVVPFQQRLRKAIKDLAENPKAFHREFPEDEARLIAEIHRDNKVEPPESTNNASVSGGQREQPTEALYSIEEAISGLTLEGLLQADFLDSLISKVEEDRLTTGSYLSILRLIERNQGGISQLRQPPPMPPTPPTPLESNSERAPFWGRYPKVPTFKIEATSKELGSAPTIAMANEVCGFERADSAAWPDPQPSYCHLSLSSNWGVHRPLPMFEPCRIRLDFSFAGHPSVYFSSFWPPLPSSDPYPNALFGPPVAQLWPYSRFGR